MTALSPEARAVLVWTKDVPTVVGWWWSRVWIPGVTPPVVWWTEIVKVEVRESDGVLFTYGHHDAECVIEPSERDEWAGPIPAPVEPLSTPKDPAHA